MTPELALYILGPMTLALAGVGRWWVAGISEKADIGVMQADRVNALVDRVARLESTGTQCKRDCDATTATLTKQVFALDKAVGSLASSDAVSGLRADMAELRANMANLVEQMSELKAAMADMAKTRHTKGR